MKTAKAKQAITSYYYTYYITSKSYKIALVTRSNSTCCFLHYCIGLLWSKLVSPVATVLRPLVSETHSRQSQNVLYEHNDDRRPLWDKLENMCRNVCRCLRSHILWSSWSPLLSCKAGGIAGSFFNFSKMRRTISWPWKTAQACSFHFATPSGFLSLSSSSEL